MIPEITGRFPQTSEDFPTARKVLGNFKEFGRLKGKFLRDYKLHSESYDYRDGSLACCCTTGTLKYSENIFRLIIGHTTQLSNFV